ncbi:MAG TPA: TIR domain-containing protein [Candidatus Acidoferrales bacterium]|nr:TIR domain-containing protein [Candidatus Acidoferrales bacterium]
MSRLSDVRDQVEAWIDHLNQYSEISERNVRRLHDVAYASAFAHMLLDGKRNRFGGYEFRTVSLRELDGRESLTVMAVNRGIRCSRNLRVFVGHRFTPAVTRNLRHNLQIVLRPYGIRPVYSDSDMPNGPVFETILERIRAADFSIFDDRETEVRPNVLIELGAAIGMRKPYFYFNYGKKRTVRINNRHEPIATASDLAGMLYLAYTSYRGLFVEFARRLPGFLLDRSLAK